MLSVRVANFHRDIVALTRPLDLIQPELAESPAGGDAPPMGWRARARSGYAEMYWRRSCRSDRCTGSSRNSLLSSCAPQTIRAHARTIESVHRSLIVVHQERGHELQARAVFSSICVVSPVLPTQQCSVRGPRTRARAPWPCPCARNPPVQRMWSAFGAALRSMRLAAGLSQR